MVQEELEQEVADYLERERYEGPPGRSGGAAKRVRAGAHPHGGMRNRAASGQLRGMQSPYKSKLMQFVQGNSDALERLVIQMYARVLCTRDIEEAFRDPYAEELVPGRTATSDLAESLC